MKLTARFFVEVTIVEVFAVAINMASFYLISLTHGCKFGVPDWSGPILGVESVMCVGLLFCFLY